MTIVRPSFDLLLVAVIAASAQLLGCSSDSGETTVPPDAGSPPEGGAPEEACPAGELELDDGTCRRAGIAAGECGEGFEHDGEDSCAVVLPAAPCEAGSLAIPGETACRQVAPCGDGAWGDIPVDATTQYVDAAYAGVDSDGSADKPWTTVQAGVDAAAAGGIVAIAAGSYLEHVLVEGKAVRLWGKCPADVEIVGPPGAAFVIDIRHADGTEVRDLAITGDGLGFAVAGSEDVIGERLWIHHTSEPGWSVQNFGGDTSSALRRSLIEQVTGVGGYGIGAAMTLEESVVRGTEAGPDGIFGRGLNVHADPGGDTPSTLVVRRSIVEGSHEAGVFAYGSMLLLEDSLVRDTQPSVADNGGGANVGLWYQDDAGLATSGVIRRSVITGSFTSGVQLTDSSLEMEATVVSDVAPMPSDATTGLGVGAVDNILRSEGQSKIVLRRSVIERAHFLGVAAAGVDVTAESLVVRDIEEEESSQKAGRGISVELNMTAEVPTPGSGAIRGCRVERTSEAGIAFVGSTGSVEGTLVRDVQPRGVDGRAGRGISAEVDAVTRTEAVVTIDRVLIEQAHEFGILIIGSQATIDRAVVRDTETRPYDGKGGVGIGIQFSFETGARSQATIRRSTCERNHESGIFVVGSDAEIEDVLVRDSLARDGDFGDGILVSLATLDGDELPAAAKVSSTTIEGSARAGISNFGADVFVGGSQLECNLIHLDGEQAFGKTFTLVDLGGNRCACAGAAVDCQVSSSNLSAPDPLQ
jgi:hypothetical protein